MMKATATTAFAIVGLMYIFQEHSIEMKQSNNIIEAYKKQQNLLESNLTTSIKHEEILKGKSLQLLTELDKVNLKHKKDVEKFNKLLAKKDEQLKLESNNATKLLDEAKEITKKIELDYQAKSKEVEELLEQQSNIEENLSTQIEKNSLLAEEKNKIKERISEILTIDKMNRVNILLTEQENLEANLTHEIAKENQLTKRNSELKNIIKKMLQIAKSATKQATMEHNKEMLEYQSLLVKYKNLEENLTQEIAKENQLLDTKSQLEAKIKEEIKEKKLLESNFKAEIDKENSLKLELKDEIAKEEALKVELNSSIGEKNSFIQKNKKLSFEMSELLFISKESREKEEIAHQKKIKELESKLAKEIKKEQTLKADLTAEKKQEESLKEKNKQLQSKLLKQIEVAKKEKESALSKAKSKIKVLEAKLAQEIKNKNSLESNLSVELKQEKALIKEKISLKSKITEQISLLDKEIEKEKLLETNLTSQIDKQALLMEKQDELESQIIELTATVESKNQEMQDLLEEIEKKKRAREEKLIQEKNMAKKKLLEAFDLTKVEFELNSMKLTAKSEKLLNTTAEVMKRYPSFHYNIQGHTDNRGNEEFNIKLSGQRAKQVKKYLISRGIREDILSTEGIGSAQPIADNETPEGRNLNRRVVFEIIKE